MDDLARLTSVVVVVPGEVAHDEARARGAEFRLAIRSGAVSRLLILLGLDQRLYVYPSVDLALEPKPAAH